MTIFIYNYYKMDTIIDIDDERVGHMDMRCSHFQCYEYCRCVGIVIFMVSGFGVGLVFLIKFIVGDI